MLAKADGSRLEISRFFQFPPNTVLAKLLPLRLFRIYLYVLGAGYYLVNREERLTTSRTYTQALHSEANPALPRHSLANAFLGIFDHYYEKLVLAYRPKPKMRAFLVKNAVIQNRRWLDQASGNGEGALVLTGHFGGLEFLPVVLSLNGYATAIIVGFKTERIKRATMETAKFFDILAIDVEEPLAFVRCIDAIKSGKILVLPCDEFKHWSPSRNNHLSIFGTIVPQDRTLDVLYRRTGVPTCLGLLAREKNKYALKIDPITDGGNEFSLSSQAWPILEKYIRKYPDQWYQWNSVAEGLSRYRLKKR